MTTDNVGIKGVRLTVSEKPEFEAAGFKKSVNLGDGSIDAFLRRLAESGKMKKLSETISAPQQIWVCLSDCQSCGLNCKNFDTCCRVCVRKTERHDFSSFAENEIYTFSVPASMWALYETTDKTATENLHKAGVYEVIRKVGYKWNENIRLHFDNQHDCIVNGAWVAGKTYRFLLPVVPAE